MTFPRFRLFVVQAISLGHCRRPIEFWPHLTPAGIFQKSNLRKSLGHWVPSGCRALLGYVKMWQYISFDSIVQSRTNLINFLPQKSKVWSAPLNIIVSAPADHFIWLMDSIKSEILLRVYSQYELRVGCVVSAWIFWYWIDRVIGLYKRDDFLFWKHKKKAAVILNSLMNTN